MKTYNRAMAVQRLEEAEDAGENTEAAIRMIKPAQLDNFDIPEIVDGKPGYELKKRPWSYCFTPAKIFKCWMNIGFIPSPARPSRTRRCATCSAMEVQVTRFRNQ